MKKWDIWAEGFRATGEGSGATCMARGVEAESFEEACRKYFKDDPYFGEKPVLNHWGCKLFDNETDARKAFG